MTRPLDALWTHGPDGLAIIDKGRISDANGRFASMLGTPTDSPNNKELVSLVEPLNDPSQHIADLVAGRVVGPLKVTSNHNGSILELRSLPLEDEVLIIARDVSVNHRNELELAQKRKALEESLNGYDIVSAEGLFLYANRAYLDMWGYDHVDEILGTSPAGHCADPNAAMEIIQAVEQYGRTTKEFTARRKDGSTFDVMMAIQISKNECGDKVYVGTSIDISETKRLRNELVQFQKMEAIGGLAANIAHDSNNLLLPVLTYAELLLGDGRLGPDSREYVQEIRLAASRLSEMTSRLLAMSRKQILEPRPTDLNEVIRREEKLLRTTLREHIKLEIVHSAASVRVLIDPSQIERLLLNLVANAQDAMPHGGNLTIEVGERELDEEYCKGRFDVKPGTFGELIVSDSGEGMSAETLQKVFEPFFTTKGTAGTGLGLASVHGIVKQHGGNIWVYSEIGRGTTFKVYLPITNRPAHPSEAPRKLEPIDVDATVLIVEDDASVRKAAEHVLGGVGFRVQSFSSGEEALDWLRTCATPPDLLLTDVILRDTDGRQLSTEAQSLHPRLRTLYMSGYTHNVIVHHGVLDSGIDLIAKPFSASELITRVRQALAGPSA